ncbi:hypothetical protein BTO05_01000 [Winogradskyella sp. PC-19]|uniref:hypothetical protein n=1 Tax=Winogradskyella sp. PC-19 TaxID=754417 RepID=UPI000B3CB0D0|nr:hypothetical protein [Winogradskyella sp. PC-19]ARV08284.1 hypothetical protein BTO05_01000 [Winogradskyella sp. PC-19]RZN74412.1 MAG: hypothetical protein EVB12_08400 [Winogradskyella sp.]
MTEQEAKHHLYELWQNGEIPHNFTEDHSDYYKAVNYTKKNNRFDYEDFCSSIAIIKFGVWQVESDALVGKVGYDYIIADSRFWETQDYNGHLVWSWLIHLTEKSWIDKLTVKDLNTAFFFCQDYYKEHKPENLPYVSTAQTLNIQKQLLDISEEIQKKEKVDKNGIVDFDIEGMMEYGNQLNNIKYL